MFVESKIYAKQKEWYYTNAAKIEWDEDVKLYFDEMCECWNDNRKEFIKAYAITNFSARKEHEEILRKTENWPAMFLKRYFIAVGCKNIAAHSAYIGIMAADCDSNKGEGIVSLEYPDIINPEKNPLLKVAIKLEKSLGDDFVDFWDVENYIFQYILNSYRDGIDVTEEAWIYDKETYRKRRSEEEYDMYEQELSKIKRISKIVKYPEYFYKLTEEQEEYMRIENINARKIERALRR